MYKLLKQGRQHRRLHLECQDAVDGGEKSGVVAIAAADASSNSNYGKRGAEIAVETMLHLLLNHFQELYKMQKEDIQYTVIVRVRNRQYEFCQRHGITLDDVKCTLLAFAYEKETNRTILLHLGDGYIVVKSNGCHRIVSYPKNSGNSYRTYMTSTIPASDKMKVYCGRMEGLEEAVLFTDGWEEYLHTAGEIECMLTEIRKKDDWEGEDDLGLISMNLNDAELKK